MNEVRMRARVIGPTGKGLLRVTVHGPGETATDLDVPIEQIPSECRMPNSEFVAVMRYGEFRRVESAGRAWLEIQRQIRAVLNDEWDPIGVADSVSDEYDGYIAGLHSMLMQGESSDSIASHLTTLESQMGITVNRIEHLRGIAEKLRALRLPTIVDAR
jgi:hypothetical protein